MPMGRIPGPTGLGDSYGCILYPPSLGKYPGLFGDDFPHATPGSMGMNFDLGAAVAAPAPAYTAEDEKELKLLQSVYGVRGAKKAVTYKKLGPKPKKGKAPVLDDVEAYVKDRDAFFGSASDYQDFLKASQEELDADDKLRNLIEPNLKTRKKFTDWKLAQNVFYAWVRKAYHKKYKDDKLNVPGLIKSGMSEKLKKALEKVRVDSGKQFKAGGFNPRPMKLAGKYRLGTLSDHATGTAIDIDDSKNAQIESRIWTQILTYTGKTLDHATRQQMWKDNPEGLFKLIKEINDEFVKKIDQAVKDVEAAQAKAAAAKAKEAAAKPAVPEKKADPFDTALTTDANLKKVDAGFVRRWRNGFFALEWELVKALHENDFLWGATFSDPDLHHFEL